MLGRRHTSTDGRATHPSAAHLSQECKLGKLPRQRKKKGGGDDGRVVASREVLSSAREVSGVRRWEAAERETYF
jgi:hypothetical protein